MKQLHRPGVGHAPDPLHVPCAPGRRSAGTWMRRMIQAVSHPLRPLGRGAAVGLPGARRADRPAAPAPPAAPPRPTRPAAQGGPIPMAPRHGGRPQFILVVTADTDWGRAIADHLHPAGYLVLTAHSVQEASDQLAVQPVLLVLDVRLPDASGWDLLAWLAADDRHPPTVVIAPGPPPARLWGRTAALMVLPPPVAVATLVAIVQEHVLTPTTPFGT